MPVTPSASGHWNERIPVERWVLRCYQFAVVSEVVSLAVRILRAVTHG